MFLNPMQNSEYTKIYSTLGVFQDDGWETIRNAYKRQIKRWHPDRFQNLDHRKIAEEKSKEINHAYQKLSDYYQKFGVLPPDHITDHTQTDDTRPKAAQHQDSPSPEYAYAYSDTSSQPKNRRGYVSVVITGILLAIGYSLWEPEFFGGQDTHQVDVAEHPGLGAESASPGLDQGANETDAPEAISVNNATDQAAVHGSAWSTESTYKKKSPASPSSYKTAFDMESASAPTSSQPLLIKKGSSKKDVLAVQGPPQRQTDSAWDYGVSRIYFQGDYVSSWHENPMNPLSVAR